MVRRCDTCEACSNRRSWLGGRCGVLASDSRRHLSAVGPTPSSHVAEQHALQLNGGACHLETQNRCIRNKRHGSIRWSKASSKPQSPALHAAAITDAEKGVRWLRHDARKLAHEDGQVAANAVATATALATPEADSSWTVDMPSSQIDGSGRHGSVACRATVAISGRHRCRDRLIPRHASSALTWSTTVQYCDDTVPCKLSGQGVWIR